MNTMTNYDSIDEALNTTSAIDVKPVSTPKKVKKNETDDVKKDISAEKNEKKGA